MKFYLSSYKFGTEDKKSILREWIKKYDNKLVFISNSRDARENTKEKFEKIESDKNLLNAGYKSGIRMITRKIRRNYKYILKIKTFN